MEYRRRCILRMEDALIAYEILISGNYDWDMDFNIVENARSIVRSNGDKYCWTASFSSLRQCIANDLVVLEWSRPETQAKYLENRTSPAVSAALDQVLSELPRADLRKWPVKFMYMTTSRGRMLTEEFLNHSSRLVADIIADGHIFATELAAPLAKSWFGLLHREPLLGAIDDFANDNRSEGLMRGVVYYLCVDNFIEIGRHNSQGFTPLGSGREVADRFLSDFSRHKNVISPRELSMRVVS